MLKRIKSKPFQIKEFQRFHTTKLDIIVFTIVFIAFIYAFYIDSFHDIVRDSDGKPISYKTEYGEIHYLERINDFAVIGPIVIIYEMFVLIVLNGKPKGREIPFHLYIEAFNQQIKEKIKSGIQEYKERIK